MLWGSRMQRRQGLVNISIYWIFMSGDDVFTAVLLLVVWQTCNLLSAVAKLLVFYVFWAALRNKKAQQVLNVVFILPDMFVCWQCDETSSEMQRLVELLVIEILRK